MALTRAALTLLPVLLGGCAFIDIVRVGPPAPPTPWTEHARRCYELDRNGQYVYYQAGYTNPYRGLTFPGRVWLVGMAACDAYVDEMMALEGRSAIVAPPPPLPSVPGAATGPSMSPAPVLPPLATPPAVRPAPSEFRPAPELRTIYFDFDQSVIRSDARPALDATAEWLKADARARLLIEGHCDERGTNEYNLALGERRARAARDSLVSRGVRADRITTISYGEERPVCTESTEACWQLNRRAEFRRRPD